MNQAVDKKNCEKCGNEITSEELINKQAGLVQGVLLCPVCVEEKRHELIEAQKTAAQKAKQPVDLADVKIALIEEGEMPKGREAPRIRSFAESSSLGGAHHEQALKRPVSAKNEPATRCRTFHGKLTPAALAHMDDLINEFLDKNPETYVKFATSSVGLFEAKLHAEPHLIMTIFY
jgi:hypothetical protein